jgi:8-oxo-dGTP diphosphatase
MMEVVCAIILNKESKIFAARRAIKKSFSGCWEFPGGKIQGNETPIDAIKREILEELGVLIMDPLSLKQISWSNSSGSFTLEAFVCKNELRDLTLTDHDKSGWFVIQELLEMNLMQADLALVPFLEKHLLET